MGRTRIVATIGPATAAPDTIDALLDAGLDVARVNCAHGTAEERRALIERLRGRAAGRPAPLAILTDLAGPKLRVGRLQGGAAALVAGQPFALTTDDVVGDATLVSITYRGLPDDVRVGEAVFLDDGLLRLRVTAVAPDRIDTRIEVGGTLSDHKGLSVPGAALGLPALTEQDERDLDALAADPPDFVGLSFVRSAQDVARLRAALRARGIDAAVVAKIEKAQALEQLDDLIAAADAIMIARGDLGVECPIAQVPILQKRIIAACRQAARPVITATQMLESMVGNPRPTRAEASDVANAVLDGSDAVMLSAETATGRYPVETVRAMRAIIEEAERFADEQRRPPPLVTATVATDAAIGRSAALAADSIAAGAIVCLTVSGATARAVARWRPRQPVLVATANPTTWRRTALLWGAEAHLGAALSGDFDQTCARLVAELRERRRLPAGATVVITAGLPFGQHGRTNTLRIERL